MARFIPKQFAENSTTSVVFGSFQEQGGNVGDGTISSDPATLQGGTAWPLGWSAATDNFFQIPRGEEMEGLERVLSAAIIQQFTDGLTFWQSEMPVTQYQTIVQYQTGSDLPKLYINITGSSTSTPPDSDTTNWYMFCDTGAPLANVDLSNLSVAGQAVIDGKADIDASNFNADGKSLLSGLSAPSTAYEDWTLLASNNDYDVPANGWLTFVKQATGAQQNVLLFEYTNNVIASYGISWSTTNGQNIGTTVRVRKGQKIRATYSAGGPTQYFRFFYDVGEV